MYKKQTFESMTARFFFRKIPWSLKNISKCSFETFCMLLVSFFFFLLNYSKATMTVFGFFLPSLKDSFRLLMLRRKKSFLVQQEQGLFLCLRPRRWVSNAQGVFLFGRLHFLKGKKEKHKHYIVLQATQLMIVDLA